MSMSPFVRVAGSISMDHSLLLLTQILNNTLFLDASNGKHFLRQAEFSQSTIQPREDIHLMLLQMGMQWHSCPGSWGVTIPGDVLELWRYVIETHGQWAWWGWFRVEFGDLRGLFQHQWCYDSTFYAYLIANVVVWKFSPKQEALKELVFCFAD